MCSPSLSLNLTPLRRCRQPLRRAWRCVPDKIRLSGVLQNARSKTADALTPAVEQRRVKFSPEKKKKKKKTQMHRTQASKLFLFLQFSSSASGGRASTRARFSFQAATARRARSCVDSALPARLEALKATKNLWSEKRLILRTCRRRRLAAKHPPIRLPSLALAALPLFFLLLP